MKVLFTGMGSSHCGPTDSMGFFRALVDVASYAGIDASWEAPNINWTKEHLDQFDAVFVGILPPTSPSANKLYGSLHVIGLLADSPKLHLVVDHPQIWQFKSSIASVSRNIDSIYTDFYAKRRDYKAASAPEIKSVIETAIQKLSTNTWPKTVYPKLPWGEDETVAKFLTENLIGVNLDAFLLEEPGTPSTQISQIWHIDNPSTSWAKRQGLLLSNPVFPMKDSSKSTDADVAANISDSIGSLITPQDRGVGTWWSYRFIQSLNLRTPVVSEWRETGKLGMSWDLLASSLEDLSFMEILALALEQRTSYIQAIPDKNNVVTQIQQLVEAARLES